MGVRSPTWTDAARDAAMAAARADYQDAAYQADLARAPSAKSLGDNTEGKLDVERGWDGRGRGGIA